MNRGRLMAMVVLVVLLGGCGGVDYQPAPARTDSEQARWWAWALAQPTETSPLAFHNDDSCVLDQPTDVWFLVGTADVDNDAACTVAAGGPLLAPVLITLAVDRAYCTRLVESLKYNPVASAKLDNRVLPLEVLAEELIEVDAAPNNILKGSGVVQGFACGVWVRVPPLTAGRHSLDLTGGLGRGKETPPTNDHKLNLFAKSQSRPVVPAPKPSRSLVRASVPDGRSLQGDLARRHSADHTDVGSSV